MKKVLIALVILGSFAGTIEASTSTTTAAVGGHRRPLVAGYHDSINNKGAWLLENPSGRISYVVESPVTQEEVRVRSIWLKEILNWLSK